MKRICTQLGLKSLAVILSALMILYAIPTTVFAQISEFMESSIDEWTHPGFRTASETFELVDKREETVKQFRDTDGSIVVAQYDLPIHYADENGEWRDIDNTLQASESDFVTGDSRIKFAKKITGNSTLFTLHDGNRKITMHLDGAVKKTVGQVTEYATDDESMTALQKLMTLTHLSSSILYADILPGVDLEYVLQS